MSLKIKLTSKNKKPYLRINNQKYIGFKVSKLPKPFAEPGHKQKISTWFNYQGYTFILKSHIPTTPWA